SSLIQIAAARINGERRMRPTAARTRSMRGGISGAPSSGPRRLLPAATRAVAEAVPEAEEDRGLGQHVVAAEAHDEVVGQAAGEEGDDEQRQLDEQGQVVEPAAAEQHQVGDEDEDVEEGR